MQFRRTVNRNVEMLAQRQTADVLALAFYEIDKFIVNVEEIVRQRQMLHHVCNERKKDCACTYCELVRKIKELQVCRSMAQYPYCFSEVPGYAFYLDVKLNKLHNLRRQLLGVPIRLFVHMSKSQRYIH